MCGIITIINGARPVNNELLIERFIAQRTRGTEGFGFTYLTPKGYLRTLRFQDEALCFYNLASVKSHLIMLHHRRPTSTDNLAFQNHPICCKTEGGYYAMIHNGVIANCKEVKEDHHKDIKYETEGKKDFNDSETLLHELVRNIETGEGLRCYGSIAFVLLVADKKRKFLRLHFGRNHNPLYHALLTDGTEIISSENSAMEIKDMVSENELKGLTITKKKIEYLETKAVKFPSYSDKFPIVSRYGQGSQAGYGDHTGQGKWFKDRKGDKTLADGSIMRKGFEAASKGIPRNAHERYIDTLLISEMFVVDLDGMTKDNKSADEIQGVLKDIDEVIKELDGANQTRRVIRAKEALVAHRARLLPHAPPPNLLSQVGGAVHSLFRRKAITDGDTNSESANDAEANNQNPQEVTPPPAIITIEKDAVAALSDMRRGMIPSHIHGLSQEEFMERLDSGMYPD